MYSISSNSNFLIVDDRILNELENFMTATYTINDLHSLVYKLNSNDIILQHEGIVGIRKILVQDNPPIDLVINQGLIPIMFAYARQADYPQLQLEAAWALTNIASGTSAHCQCIVYQGGIPLFVDMIKSPFLGIVEQAVWAVGNLSSDRIIYRDKITQLGGISNIIQVIQNNIKQERIVQICAWTLSTLCRGMPLPKYEAVKEAVNILCQLIANDFIKKKENLQDVLWAIGYSTDQKQGKKLISSYTRLIQRAVYHLSDNEISLVVPCLRIIGNLTAISLKEVDIVLNSNGINQLYQALNHDKKIVRRQVCWVLSNIAAESMVYADQILINISLIERLLALFKQDSADVKKQICFIFANIVCVSQRQRGFQFFKHYSVLKNYLSILNEIDDEKALDASLECLQSILSRGKNFPNSDENLYVKELLQLDIIESLKKIVNSTNNPNIHKRAKNLIQTYFKDNETEFLCQAFDQKMKIIEE